MEIVFNSPLKEALKRVLNVMLGEANDLCLVCAEYKPTEDSNHTDFEGLEIARDFAENPEKFVILMSFMDKEGLFSHKPNMAGILSFQNVAFLELPPDLKEIVEIYTMLKNGKKKEDKLARLVFEAEMLDRAVSILRHDLHYAERDETQKEKWIEQAQKAGFTGTFDEIVSSVKKWNRTAPGRFEGKHLDGVFVDFQGTLVVNGELNEKILELIEKVKGDRSVCVISDSDLNDVAQELKRLRISYPIMSKFELKGAALEIVIDSDFSQIEFQKEYGIVPMTFF